MVSSNVPRSYVVPSCMSSRSAFASGIHVFSVILRSLFSGNSDLQSRNASLSDELQNKVIRARGLAACCTLTPI